jgi:hypothetical protein
MAHSPPAGSAPRRRRRRRGVSDQFRGLDDNQLPHDPRDGAGTEIEGAAGTVFNYGTVSGAGIRLTAAANVTNASGGVILGGGGRCCKSSENFAKGRTVGDLKHVFWSLRAA